MMERFLERIVLSLLTALFILPGLSRAEIFHLLQMIGVLALAAGLRAALRHAEVTA